MQFRARALQGLADTAAVSAAGNLATAEPTVRRVLSLKNSTARIETVALGEYHARAEVPIPQRFNPSGPLPDAVQVVLQEDIQVLGLGVALPGLPNQLRTILGEIAAPLDLVLQLVGVGIGEADIRPAGLLCGIKGSPPTLAA